MVFLYRLHSTCTAFSVLISVVLLTPAPLSTAIYGTNIAAMTLMLVGYNRTDPSHHFVAIRQHNLAVDKRYMLKAELNCLLNYSKGPDTIAPESGVHTKWYRNGQRIRKDRLETYLFSLTGEDRSILLLTDFQDNMNHTEELNGEYVCAVYNRKGLLIVKKTFDVKICKFASESLLCDISHSTTWGGGACTCMDKNGTIQ